MDGDAHITEATQPGGAPVLGGGAESTGVGGRQGSAPNSEFIKARTKFRHSRFAKWGFYGEEGPMALELITRPAEIFSGETEMVLSEMATEEAA